MKARELLLECKIAAKISTDYALAKRLEIPTQRIADYMSGKRKPDVYASVKIALCLKRDPAEIIALIESETEKNEKRQEFWRNFLARVQKVGRLYTLAALCMLSLLAGHPADREGGFKAA